MKKYIAIAAMALFTACGDADTKAEEEQEKEGPLSQSKNSEGFNDKFTDLLKEYYHLKDALVLTNDTLAITRAKTLAATADGISIKDIKGDTSVIESARQYIELVSTGAKEIASANNIEARRKTFNDLSDNMYNLIIAVHYDKQVVYHQFCSMAFNDAGAYWLNPTPDIKNPYFGKKMLTCGDVKDSIDFRAK